MTRRRPSTQSAALAAALAKPTGCAIDVPSLGVIYVPRDVEAGGGAAVDAWLRGLGLTDQQLTELGLTVETPQAVEEPVSPTTLPPAE